MLGNHLFFVVVRNFFFFFTQFPRLEADGVVGKDRQTCQARDSGFADVAMTCVSAQAARPLVAAGREQEEGEAIRPVQDVLQTGGSLGLAHSGG